MACSVQKWDQRSSHVVGLGVEQRSSTTRCTHFTSPRLKRGRNWHILDHLIGPKMKSLPSRGTSQASLKNAPILSSMLGRWYQCQRERWTIKDVMHQPTFSQLYNEGSLCSICLVCYVWFWLTMGTLLLPFHFYQRWHSISNTCDHWDLSFIKVGCRLVCANFFTRKHFSFTWVILCPSVPEHVEAET